MAKALLIIVAVITCIVFAIAGWFVYLAEDTDQRDQASAQVPVITLMEILHASDLQAGVKEAVKNGDKDAIHQWMEQAQVVAEAGHLAQTHIEYLDSQQAYDYVVFNAKRQLFNEAFEARYYALEDMGNLKDEYPEAYDLFERTEALLEKRDAIIVQMAQALSGTNPPSDAALNEAKQRWLARAEGDSLSLTIDEPQSNKK
ncbi:hypothetical protein ALT761_01562 [Alteromonas sp. 76-1]|uniref:hypothetical protein n=1 Tax=Alteromonas sp. 76-1 TaxID=2358187 RepID=UPI000FD166B2|nr:hypothetical protein [Alteromonas sp. 76-1]VEL96574.1 hypothetical protein ALT761_01562 [Alteromonas sp. 76-1]